MTSWKKRCFSLARWFGFSSALILTFWLVAATAAPAQTFNLLLSFDGKNGANPSFMSLVQGRDGNYYGITSGGGTYGGGTVFTVTSAGKLTKLYNFCAQANCADGGGPQDALVLATDGNFYGTTSGGGANGGGTVFKITPKGTLTTLYSFCAQTNCTDGTVPLAGLIQAMDGNFYGTASGGGANGRGTVFKMTPAGTLTTLYNFCSWARCRDGSVPLAPLVQGADGSFYGTTDEGGAGYGPECGDQGCGAVFKITPGGKMRRLHGFRQTDGGQPYAGLVQGSDGNFYGTTSESDPGAGLVFQITPGGALTTLFQLCYHNPCPGEYPYAALVQATDGNFYGTTSNGGSSDCDYGCGIVFQVTPSGTLTSVHNFVGTDGAYPLNGLLQATSGILYGVTTSGGASNNCSFWFYYPGCGTVFSLDMGLGPFVAFVRNSGRVGSNAQILGQGFTGTTGVSFNGTSASFAVKSDTYLTATVPQGATTGFVTVTTPSGTLQSNVMFQVRP